MSYENIVARAEKLLGDTSLGSVRAWKEANPGRPAIGHLPVYTPREIIHACGGLPVALQGGGDAVEVIRGDACFQSYICHLPRSTVELGLSGDYDALDGLTCPGTCDVIRNLSGIWQILFPKKAVRYLDLPQTFDASGRSFYRRELEELGKMVESCGGVPLTTERLAASLAAFDENRAAVEALYDLRAEAPHLVPTAELYLVVRAGNVIPVEEHTAMLRAFADACRSRPARREDRIRVVAVGAFCEQPPLGLLRSLERAGCFVVDDDFCLGARHVKGPLATAGDPLDSLVHAYSARSRFASSRWNEEKKRGEDLVRTVRERGAEGVVLMAPSFCDPALLDQPPLQTALDDAGVPYTTFKYAENTGQFQGIREQAGTFADSIKLWGEA